MERFADACPVRLGDGWEQVSAATNTSAPPEQYLVNGRPKGFQQRLPEQGLCIFFDETLHVRDGDPYFGRPTN